jgi:hypothetical protein
MQSSSTAKELYKEDSRIFGRDRLDEEAKSWKDVPCMQGLNMSQNSKTAFQCVYMTGKDARHWTTTMWKKRLLTQGQALVLDTLIYKQNCITGQLNVTNEELGDECKIFYNSSIGRILGELEDLFPTAFDIDFYKNEDLKHRRQIFLDIRVILYATKEILKGSFKQEEVRRKMSNSLRMIEESPREKEFKRMEQRFIWEMEAYEDELNGRVHKPHFLTPVPTAQLNRTCTLGTVVNKEEEKKSVGNIDHNICFANEEAGASFSASDSQENKMEDSPLEDLINFSPKSESTEFRTTEHQIAKLRLYDWISDKQPSKEAPERPEWLTDEMMEREAAKPDFKELIALEKKVASAAADRLMAELPEIVEKKVERKVISFPDRDEKDDYNSFRSTKVRMAKEYPEEKLKELGLDRSQIVGRTMLHPKYNPEKHSWNTECHTHYALMTEEQRDREFLRIFDEWMWPAPAWGHSKRNLSMIKNTRKRADSIRAAYTHYIEAQYAYYSGDEGLISYNCICSKDGVQRYIDWVANGMETQEKLGNVRLQRQMAKKGEKEGGPPRKRKSFVETAHERRELLWEKVKGRKMYED